MILALACIGFFLTIRKRDPSPYGFLALYAFFLAAIYSLIPYKTPWLALNLWLPVTLFAALAIGSLWRVAERHLSLLAAIPALTILAAIAAAFIAHDTRQRVFMHPADETNPYAYAHTSEDLLGLPAEIEEFARQNAIEAPRIAVIASDPWPLPWYLRHFAQVGFWQPGQQVGEADFYITSTDAAEHTQIGCGTIVRISSECGRACSSSCGYLRRSELWPKSINSTTAPWRRTFRFASPMKKERMPRRPHSPLSNC